MCIKTGIFAERQNNKGTESEKHGDFAEPFAGFLSEPWEGIGADPQKLYLILLKHE